MIINSITIKNSIIYVINTVEPWEAFLYYVFLSRIAVEGIASSTMIFVKNYS